MVALQDKIASFRHVGNFAANGANGTAQTVAIHTDGWQRIIDDQLIEWGRHPEQFDDDVKCPTPSVLANACEFASFCRDRAIDPPLRVVPDGSGGIVFEWRDDSLFYSVEINVSGRAELLVFRNSKLVSRKPIG